MPSLMETLGINRLSEEERLQLADEIYESVGDERKLPPLSDAHRRELDERLERLDAGTVKSSPLDEVRARLQAYLTR